MSHVDLKVVLLGKRNCGKTCLVERYLNDRYLELPYQSTIGAAFGAKRVEVDGKGYTVGIWDTAGGERYEAMSKIYYRKARGAVICYDVTDSTSFERAQFWVNELKANEENCRVYLCGTKKDLIHDDPNRREVSLGQIHRFAADINAEVFETSSKTGENVRDLFTKIVEDFVADSRKSSTTSKENIKLQAPRKKVSCCEETNSLSVMFLEALHCIIAVIIG
ncbi:Ras-protein Rab-24 [Chamberlinius hualienensis]